MDLSSFAQFLNSNPIVGGGAMLALAGGLFQSLRHVPARAASFAHRHLVTTVSVTDDDPSFAWLQRWLSVRMGRRNRNFSVRVLDANDEDSDDRHELEETRPQIVLSPGPGTHLIRHGRRLFLVTMERQKAEGGYQSRAWTDTYRIRVFPGDRAAVEALLGQARDEFLAAARDGVPVYHYEARRFERWRNLGTRPRRTRESLVYAAGLFEEVLGDIQKFYNRRTWYHDRGIPFRRGYLLYGPPGNGKSTLVFGLASELRLPVYYLSLSQSDITGTALTQVLSSVPARCLLVIEDIDVLYAGRSRKDAGASFADLLNNIDGLVASEGRVLFLTTNLVQDLDAALVRPGRIDRVVQIENANSHQARRMFLRFFEGAEREAAEFAAWAGDGTHSVAALQEHLLRFVSASAGTAATAPEAPRPRRRKRAAA